MVYEHVLQTTLNYKQVANTVNWGKIDKHITRNYGVSKTKLNVKILNLGMLSNFSMNFKYMDIYIYIT